MSALAPWWKRIGFEDPFLVERRLTLGTVAGLVVTGLAFVNSAALRDTSPHVFLSVLLCGLHLLLPRHNRWLMLGVVAAVLSMALSFGASARALTWLCSASLGLVLAAESPSWARRAVVAVGPALGVAWCLTLVHVFTAKYLGEARVLTWGALGLSGVLVAAASSLGQLTLVADALEPRLRVIDAKVHQTWQQLHRVARRFSPAARQQVVELASTVASRWLDARREHAELGHSLEHSQFDEANAAVERLEQRLTEVTDSELRAHLEQSMRVHRDTLEQLHGLRRRSERAEARALAEVTWLEMAVLTLELTPATDSLVTDATARLSTLATRA